MVLVTVLVTVRVQGRTTFASQFPSATPSPSAQIHGATRPQATITPRARGRCWLPASARRVVEGYGAACMRRLSGQRRPSLCAGHTQDEGGMANDRYGTLYKPFPPAAHTCYPHTRCAIQPKPNAEVTPARPTCQAKPTTSSRPYESAPPPSSPRPWAAPHSPKTH